MSDRAEKLRTAFKEKIDATDAMMSEKDEAREEMIAEFLFQVMKLAARGEITSTFTVKEKDGHRSKKGV